MIIPIRCMSCGKPIAHLWKEFKERTAKDEEVKAVLDDLGLERYCCRSVFISHEDYADLVAKFKKS